MVIRLENIIIIINLSAALAIVDKFKAFSMN